MKIKSWFIVLHVPVRMTVPENSLQSLLTIANPMPLLAPVTLQINSANDKNHLWKSTNLIDSGCFDPVKIIHQGHPPRVASSFDTRIKFLLGHIWLSISSKVIHCLLVFILIWLSWHCQNNLLGTSPSRGIVFWHSRQVSSWSYLVKHQFEGHAWSILGGTWVFFGWVCAAQGSKLFQKTFALKLIPHSWNRPVF